MRSEVDALAAEVRSVELGHRAFIQSDGTFLVRSASRPGIRWRVRTEAVLVGGRWKVRFRCECESGSARPSGFLVCHHGATVGRRLEREGWCFWENGGFWLTGTGMDAVERLEPKTPKTWKTWTAKGRCPSCSKFLSVTCNEDDDPHEVASRHDEKCRSKYAQRKAATESQQEVDLWDRTL